jgi:hypothetical protein
MNVGDVAHILEVHGAACPSKMLEILLISTWSNNPRRESPSLSKLGRGIIL